jgi:hypothetical protein
MVRGHLVFFAVLVCLDQAKSGNPGFKKSGNPGSFLRLSRIQFISNREANEGAYITALHT